MKNFLDCEFLEDGKTIELISIAVVRKGTFYYALNGDCNWHRVVNDPWLRENVLPSLPIKLSPPHDGRSFWAFEFEDVSLLRSRDTIAREIVEFVGEKPEFWGYYADYDWVALCQLYGRMIDLPPGWPMYCRDLKQLADQISVVVPKQEEGEHNALADALWLMHCYDYVVECM